MEKNRHFFFEKSDNWAKKILKTLTRPFLLLFYMTVSPKIWNFVLKKSNSCFFSRKHKIYGIYYLKKNRHSKKTDRHLTLKIATVAINRHFWPHWSFPLTFKPGGIQSVQNFFGQNPHRGCQKSPQIPTIFLSENPHIFGKNPPFVSHFIEKWPPLSFFIAFLCDNFFEKSDSLGKSFS